MSLRPVLWCMGEGNQSLRLVLRCTREGNVSLRTVLWCTREGNLSLRSMIAPACADRSQPARADGQVSPLPPRRAQSSHCRGVLAARWPPTRPSERCVASAGASPRPGTSSPAPACGDGPQPGCAARPPPSLPPRPAQTGHSRGVLLVYSPPSRPGVRRAGTAGACGQSTLPPPAPSCANQPQPGRAACHVSLYRPGERTPAAAGACRGMRRVKCPPSRPGVPERATTGASPPPGSSSPAPTCADLPQPGPLACLVSSLPPRPAQSRHGRGVLPKRCPRSRTGVRCAATAGVYCLTSVLPPAPACAGQP